MYYVYGTRVFNNLAGTFTPPRFSRVAGGFPTREIASHSMADWQRLYPLHVFEVRYV